MGDVVAGKFRIERVLGQGGMGIVVAATHLQLDQRVALKFLLPTILAHPEIAQRFLREARASVRIHSEHVARVLDVGTLESGVPFMVMEFLEGEDLESTLARGPVSVQNAVGFVLEACEAVAEAHALGMVHRDLKPANLFLAQRPSGKPIVKVLDFGISKLPVSERDQAITGTNAMMGSPGYMSPEQMLSSDRVDARSDIWSLGVVLYKLLAQEVPFQAETMPELVALILQKPHPPIANARPDVPPGVVAILDRCLQKEASARYSNIAELARALAPFGPRRAEQSVERIETVLGLAPPSIQPAMAQRPTAGPTENATFSPVITQTRRSRGRVVVPVLASFAMVGAGLGAFALHRRTAAREAEHAVSAATQAPEPTTNLAAPPSTTSAPNNETVAASPPETNSASAPPPTASEKGRRPVPVVRTSATHTASAPPTPSCHVVSYFDEHGDKHFKQECN